MEIWKKIIRVGDSKAIVLDKNILNGYDVDFGDEVLIDLIEFKKIKEKEDE